MKTVAIKRFGGEPCDQAEVLQRLRDAGVPVLGKTWLLGVSKGTLTVTTTANAAIYQWTDKQLATVQPEDEEDEL